METFLALVRQNWLLINCVMLLTFPSSSRTNSLETLTSDILYSLHADESREVSQSTEHFWSFTVKQLQHSAKQLK